MATVNGIKCYSSDLEKGGLKISLAAKERIGQDEEAIGRVEAVVAEIIPLYLIPTKENSL